MKKYRILFLLLVLLLGTGCISYISSCFDDIDPVWVEKTPPTENIEPPNGFKITPAEAYKIVLHTKPWMLSPKHVWHIYADSNYYYVHDAFWGSNSSSASLGVKIDGQTGEIINR